MEYSAFDKLAQFNRRKIPLENFQSDVFLISDIVLGFLLCLFSS